MRGFASTACIHRRDRRAGKDRKAESIGHVKILEELDKSGFIDRLYKRIQAKAAHDPPPTKIIEDVRSAATPPQVRRHEGHFGGVLHAKALGRRHRSQI